MTRPFVPFTARKAPEDFVPESTPTYSLERHIASLRDTDPVRWDELNRQWEEGNDR